MGMGRGMGMGMGIAWVWVGEWVGEWVWVWVWHGMGMGMGMGLLFYLGNFQPLALMLLHKTPYMSQQCCGKDSAKFGVQSINQSISEFDLFCAFLRMCVFEYT